MSQQTPKLVFGWATQRQFSYGLELRRRKIGLTCTCFGPIRTSIWRDVHILHVKISFLGAISCGCCRLLWFYLSHTTQHTLELSSTINRFSYCTVLPTLRHSFEFCNFLLAPHMHDLPKKRKHYMNTNQMRFDWSWFSPPPPPQEKNTKLKGRKILICR